MLACFCLIVIKAKTFISSILSFTHSIIQSFFNSRIYAFTHYFTRRFFCSAILFILKKEVKGKVVVGIKARSEIQTEL